MAGAGDRTTKHVRAKVVESTGRPALQGLVVEHTASDATVCSDDEATTARESLPFDHETARQGVSEYVRGTVHTNGMESFRSMLERAACTGLRSNDGPDTSITSSGPALDGRQSFGGARRGVGLRVGAALGVASLRGVPSVGRTFKAAR